nr:DciA family protein [Nitrosomonas sp. Nm51]
MEHMLAASAAIPAHLLEHCKLGPLFRSQLTLLAENASVAARLKHMTPSILQKLQKKGWQISSIKVRIQKPASGNPATTFPKQQPGNPKPGISSAGIEYLNRLAHTLPDCELRRSIEHLLRNQSYITILK